MSRFLGEIRRLAYWTQGYDEDLARMEKQGMKPVMDGEVGARGPFCYFDTESHPGAVVELSEVVGSKGRMFDLIREASKNWHGKDPVRPFPGLRTL